MDKLQQIEFGILDFINGNLSNPFLDKLMPFISLLGDYGFIWILTCVVLLFWII